MVAIDEVVERVAQGGRKASPGTDVIGLYEQFRYSQPYQSAQYADRASPFVGLAEHRSNNLRDRYTPKGRNLAKEHDENQKRKG